MSEILGLLDSLEATILDGKKIPFASKLMVDERRCLHIIDKIRLVLQSDGDTARKAIDLTKAEEKEEAPVQESPMSEADILQTAQREAEKMKSGASEYADYVLANLQLIVTKMQKNLVRLEKNIQGGREVLGMVVTESTDEGTPR